MQYIAARNHGPATNYPIKRVVIHGTVSPCVQGGALAVATMFSKSNRDASTQYVVDPFEVIQCVPDNTVAYGAPPNTGSIHVELCDMQGGSPSRWLDDLHQSMLARAAGLVASLCLKFKVPIEHIGPAELRAGQEGICGHVDISNAWHQTDHVDPGPDFPWTQFLALVNQAAHPQPPAKHRKGEAMFLVSLKSSPAQYVSNGQTRRWVPSAAYKQILLDLGCDPNVREFDTTAGMEAVAGPLVSGTPDYNPGA